MLSRLASTRQLFAPAQQWSAILQRGTATSVYKTASEMKPQLEQSMAIAEQQMTVRDWEAAHDILYGKDRDFTNFPTLRQPDEAGKVRLGFIPDNWFTFFYEKTGVTGPFLFTFGLVNFLVSKEIWVYDHAGAEMHGFWPVIALLVYKAGPGLKASLQKLQDGIRSEFYEKPKQESVEALNETIKQAEKEIWHYEGQSYLFEAKKENIALQLEAVYRQRLAEVHKEVKKRLDYQVAKENTLRRFEQNHMVDWIVQGVVQSITPKQEKESIQACITELKNLAAKA